MLIGYFVFVWCSKEAYLGMQVMKYVIIISAVFAGVLIFGLCHRHSGLIEFWLGITYIKGLFDAILNGGFVYVCLQDRCPVLGVLVILYFVNIILQLVGFVLGVNAFKEITGIDFVTGRNEGSSGRIHGYSQIPSGTPEQGSPVLNRELATV